MNPIYIVANWKEYPDNSKASTKLATELTKIAVKEKLNTKKNVVTVICPPHVYVESVGAIIKKGKYILGAQDLSPLMIGAYTGEVSPKALASVGVKYTIVGHSERRAMGESNEVILMKIKAALAAGIRPILCVGEHDRTDAEHSHADVREQLAILSELSKKELVSTIIAYEPLWAVGAKVAATPEDAREMRIYIQKIIADMVDEKSLQQIPILYGGAVTSKNAAEFIGTAGMHGLLIGRASLEAKSFTAIIRRMAEIK